MPNKMFIVHYVDDTNRQQITISEKEEYENTSHDLASRKEFSWFHYDRSHEDYSTLCYKNVEDKEDQELNAAKYARALAAKHNLQYVPQSKTDGILDDDGID